MRVCATPDAVWQATLATFHDVFAGTGARPVARLLGVDPRGVARWDRPNVGSTVPGFHIVFADRPRRLVLYGEHRFARYAIDLRFEPVAGGTRGRLESRAEFPGVHGRLYRLAVVGTHGHVVAVRRILRGIRTRAESSREV